MPAVMTYDRGAQFTSLMWSALCSLQGIQHVQTSAYHPEGNGLVERFHRRLKMPSMPAVRTPPRPTTSPGSCWVCGQLHVKTPLSHPPRPFSVQLTIGQLSQEPEMDLDDFLKQMHLTLSRSIIVSSRFNTAAGRIPPTELPAELLAATHVLVCQDSHVPPLVPLYDGPYGPMPSCGTPSTRSPS